VNAEEGGLFVRGVCTKVISESFDNDCQKLET
jgi:hypothetical protein